MVWVGIRSSIGSLVEPDRRPGSSWCGLSLRLLRLGLLRGLRTRLSDALVDLVRELPEVLDEQVDELRRGGVIFGRVRPGAARVEQLAVDFGHRDRHVEAEVGILAELDVLQAAVERGVEQRAGFLDRHALANAKFAAGPAGVDQPAVDLARGDPLLEEIA